MQRGGISEDEEINESKATVGKNLDCNTKNESDLTDGQ
jgi:hypothetical protein